MKQFEISRRAGYLYPPEPSLKATATVLDQVFRGRTYSQNIEVDPSTPRDCTE